MPGSWISGCRWAVDVTPREHHAFREHGRLLELSVGEPRVRLHWEPTVPEPHPHLVRKTCILTAGKNLITAMAPPRTEASGLDALSAPTTSRPWVRRLEADVYLQSTWTAAYLPEHEPAELLQEWDIRVLNRPPKLAIGTHLYSDQVTDCQRVS